MYPVIESHNTDGKSRLVIINDGSKDDTYEKLLSLAESRPYLIPLTKPNGGHGPTVIYGYRYAIEQGADYIFQTDSDGQTSPVEFENFWNHRDRFEAIFGMRPERGDGPVRALIEKVLCLICRVIFGVRIPDANAPYRLMAADYLRRYLRRLPKDYNLPNVMLTVFGAYDRRNITFLPISFQDRRRGVNSLNLRKITGTGFAAIHDFMKCRRRMKHH